MSSRRRLDAEIVRRGLAPSRTQAQRLIDDGVVSVNGDPATKPSTMVEAGDALQVRESDTDGYASRGAHKLAGALTALDLDVTGRTALDAGAAHGGFTDVLLRAGAVRVVAVDVAYGQLDWRLRSDPRVVVLERTNVRHLTREQVPPPAPDVVVGDLSFISLTLVLPALIAVADDDADFVLLVKPQFEAGRAQVGKGGVVRDPETWSRALEQVVEAAAAGGLGLQGACVSPLPGPSGNIEYFVHLRRAAVGDPQVLLAAAVEQGRALAAAR